MAIPRVLCRVRLLINNDFSVISKYSTLVNSVSINKCARFQLTRQFRTNFNTSLVLNNENKKQTEKNDGRSGLSSISSSSSSDSDSTDRDSDEEEANYFWLSHLVSVGIFSKKITRIILRSSLTMQILVYVFETCIYIIEPSYIMKYAPFLIARLYGTATGFVILSKHHFIENALRQDFELWSVESAGVQVRAKAKQFLNNSNVIVYCTLSIFTVCCVLLILMPNYVSVEYSLLLYMIQKWFPNKNGAIMVLLELPLTPILYSMIVHPLYSLYASQQLRLQCAMLIEHIKTITDAFEKEKPEDLIDNQLFQREIKRRLRFIVARHIQFVKLICKGNEEFIKPLFVVLVGFGFVFGLCIVVIAYEVPLNVYHFNFHSKLLLFLAGILAAFCFCYLIQSAQAFSTATEELYREITNVKWYTFNKSNRMTVMVMIVNSMEPLRLKFTTTLGVDYDLGIQMARGLYSAISLLMSLHLK